MKTSIAYLQTAINKFFRKFVHKFLSPKIHNFFYISVFVKKKSMANFLGQMISQFSFLQKINNFSFCKNLTNKKKKKCFHKYGERGVRIDAVLTGTGQEIGLMKIQLQEAIAGKSIGEDVNTALQVRHALTMRWK